MTGTRAIAILAGLGVLLAAIGTVGADSHDAADEDPFADEPPLFENETDDDPFGELEERATVDGEASEESASEDAEEENALPLPLGAALLGLGLAAVWLERSRR